MADPFANFGAWLTANKGNALLAAVAIVVGLGFFDATRRYAIPIGVVIMCVWYWKWQRQGGKL